MFGFKDIILYHNCSQPNTLELNTSYPWPVYANPGILLLLYYTVATLVKLHWLGAKVRGCRAELDADGDNSDEGSRHAWLRLPRPWRRGTRGAAGCPQCGVPWQGAGA